MSHRELYERLGVEPSASEAEIRRAYLSLARKLHPDRGAGPEAEATLARIGEAWAVLKNRRLRKVYDEEGPEGLEEIDNEGGIAPPDESDDDEDDSDDDEEHDPYDDFLVREREAVSGPSVSSFFGAVGNAPIPQGSKNPSKDDIQQAPSTAHAHNELPERGAAERETSLQIADVVAEAIRRTEDRAAARYERALSLLLRNIDPSLDAAQADERARRTWAEAK